MQRFGKRKFGGIQNNNPKDYFMSAKNQRLRPCRDIVYTEDHVPVRKLYFCVPTAEVSQTHTHTHRNPIMRIYYKFRVINKQLLTKSHCIRFESEHHYRDANHMLSLVKW